MKEIGGFPELELPERKEFHENAVALNSGRNCLRQIVRNRQIKRLLVPLYTANSVISVLRTEGVEIIPYSIDKDFFPILEDQAREYLFYINYFGINSRNVETLIKSHPKLIVDNAQAFYSRPIMDIDALYSPRKFFGVPDGGYFYCPVKGDEESLETSLSYDRSEHLLKRIDLNARAGYASFQAAEESLKGAPIRKMSKLTRRLLQSIDYERARVRRLENFTYLESSLGEFNELSIHLTGNDVPMVYPFLTSKSRLRAHLIEKSVYVATYWPDAGERISSGSWEDYLTSNLVPLIIDQRYGKRDMEIIIAIVMDFLKKESER